MLSRVVHLLLNGEKNLNNNSELDAALDVFPSQPNSNKWLCSKSNAIVAHYYSAPRGNRRVGALCKCVIRKLADGCPQ
jgi:hypothetical protein